MAIKDLAIVSNLLNHPIGPLGIGAHSLTEVVVALAKKPLNLRRGVCLFLIHVGRCNANKIFKELGWKPQETFESGINKTIDWYLNNTDWVQRVQSGDYKNWIHQQYSSRAA